jgi:hypothetical protein
MSYFTEDSMCFRFWWSLSLYVATLHTLHTCLFPLSRRFEPFSSTTSAGRQFWQRQLSVLELYLVPQMWEQYWIFLFSSHLTTLSFASSKWFHHLKTVRMFVICRPQAFYRISEVSLACFSQIQTNKKEIFSNIFYEVILTSAKMLSASAN